LEEIQARYDLCELFDLHEALDIMDEAEYLANEQIGK